MISINKNATLDRILLDLIQLKGLTLTELARQICIPQPTLHRITTGKHSRPHKKTLTAIADFFGITIEQLCGSEPIAWLHSSQIKPVHKIPHTDIAQLLSKSSAFDTSEFIVTTRSLSKHAYAITMPDESMEPLIQKGSILIVDPDIKPEYKNCVVVKLANYPTVLVRQMLKDAINSYIRPLSPYFDHIDMIRLDVNDIVLGVVVEVRFVLSE